MRDSEIDKEVANPVKEEIAKLPAKDAVTLDNKGAVTTARANFEKLTQTQKALVDNLAKLTDAEAKIAELELAAMPVGVALAETQETHKGVAAKAKVDAVPEVAAAKQEVELQVTAKASTDGNIKIDGENVAVLAADADAAAIATKIAAHNFANWTVAVKAGETDKVVFTAKAEAANTTIDTDMALTGVTVIATTTKDGAVFKAGTPEIPAVDEVKEVATTTVTAGAQKDATIKVKVADGTVDQTVDVVVAKDDTAAAVAGKIRTALAANATVNAAYDVTGADANIVLTQKGDGSDVELKVTLQ